MARKNNLLGIPKKGVYTRPNEDGTEDLTAQFTTAGMGTVTNQTIIVQRIANMMHCQGFFTTGTCSAATPYIVLPTGLNVDTSKCKISLSLGGWRVGMAFRVDVSGTPGYFNIDGGILPLIIDGSGATNKVAIAVKSTSAFFAELNATSVFNNGDSLSFDFCIPIKEWAL